MSQRWLLIVLGVAGAGCGSDNGPGAPAAGTRPFHTSENVEGEPRTVLALASAWTEYKEAVLTGNGAVAADRVTEPVHEYYESMRRHALDSDRGELMRLGISWRLAVLAMRIRMTREQLAAMSGRDLFAHAVDNGWVGKIGTTNTRLVAPEVLGDSGWGDLTERGKEGAVRVNFHRENGVWRWDLMPLMKNADAAVRQMQERSGLDEDEFLRRMVEALTHTELTDETWEPMRARSGD